MSADSSSSEDELEKIKEAIDENLLTDELYTNGKITEETPSPPKPKSLRNQYHQEISHNPFSIKVTPEFQRYVSKHLSKLLDEVIYDQEIITKRKKQKKEHLNYGVKLLSSSKNYLLSSNNFEEKKSKKFFEKENLSDRDYEKRAKEVAVSPEWVLSQEETKCWAPNTKGKIEILKLDNCKNFSQLKKHKKISKS